MIVRFDFGATGAGRLEDWRRFVREESIPRFEAMTGLRHKLFLVSEDPPEAVTVYLFADDAAFAAYADPLRDGTGTFRTTALFGAPGSIEVLDVAGIADGPEAPGREKC
jgi:hypothetical protein